MTSLETKVNKSSFLETMLLLTISTGIVSSFSLPAIAAPNDLRGMKTADFLIRTTAVGCQPKGVKADSRGEYAYVAEMCGKFDPVTRRTVPSVSVIDLKTLAPYKTIVTPIGAVPGILANTEVEFNLDESVALVARAEGD